MTAKSLIYLIYYSCCSSLLQLHVHILKAVCMYLVITDIYSQLSIVYTSRIYFSHLYIYCIVFLVCSCFYLSCHFYFYWVIRYRMEVLYLVLPIYLGIHFVLLVLYLFIQSERYIRMVVSWMVGLFLYL